MAHWPIGGPSGSLRVPRRGAGRGSRSTCTSTTRTRSCARTAPSDARSSRRAGEVAVRRHGAGSVTRRPMPLLPPDEFVARLRDEGTRRYHDQHPFHQLMHAGKLTRDELAGLDAEPLLLPDANPDQGRDHPLEVGGSRRSGAPGSAASTTTTATRSRRRRAGAVAAARRGGRPGSRRGGELPRACCRACASPATATSARAARAPLVVAVASSLTEMFAPDLMSARIAAWEKHYPWVGSEALAYFRARVPRARRDGEEALAFVVANATSRDAAGSVRRRRWCARPRSCGTSLDCVQAAYARRDVGARDDRGRRARLRLAAKVRLQRDRVSGKHVPALSRSAASSCRTAPRRIVALCDGRTRRSRRSWTSWPATSGEPRERIESEVMKLPRVRWPIGACWS